MTEYFDLYTADRRKLGRKIQRGAPIPHGEYHIVVQIMSVNSLGEILLTQRVPQKTSGGRWECSGGCAVSGETSREAAVRELFEETGFRTRLIPGARAATEYRISSVARKQVVFFLGEVHGEPKLQAKEIRSCRWVKPGELGQYLLPQVADAAKALLARI